MFLAAFWLASPKSIVDFGAGPDAVVFNKISSSSATATTSSTTILAANTARVWAKCSVLSSYSTLSAPSWVSFYKIASVNAGFQVVASGSFEITAPNLYTGPVTAITKSGTARFVCVESTGRLLSNQ